MSITVHRLYYGPIEENGLLLKTSPELRAGKILNDDTISDIYTKKGKYNQTTEDSELIHTAHGPVIRVTRIKPLQGHDNRTTQSCNVTLLVQLGDISKLLIPLLDQELTFPLQEIKLKVEKEG
jgi:hypothetical protein